VERRSIGCTPGSTGPRPARGASVRRRAVYGRARVALPTAAESAALDRDAREQHGIPERVLMENAGRSAALVLQRLFPAGRVVGLIGSGHNGGDGLVLLRCLQAWGREVAFVRASDRMPEPAPVHGFDLPEIGADSAELAFAGAGVLVDGLLGTGTSGAPRGPAAGLIRALNAAGRPVLALDLPSGVDATTGAVPGEAVRADVTVTFGWPKLGLLLHPARACCGRLVAVEIGFPPLEPGAVPAEVITPAWAAAHLPRRQPTAHKGSAGKVLIVAGRPGMAGAAVIATEAAVRAGAGLVYVASAAENRVVLQSSVPESIFRDRAEDESLRGETMDALLLGPGVGVEDDAGRAVMRRALECSRGRPTVLDADALTYVAELPDLLRTLAGERALILTPHPGEMARLTGRSIEEIQSDRMRAARAVAEEYGCVVLLKGQPSIVAAAGEPVLVNSTGSSDVAAGGMGDQLGGTITGLLAAGASARAAAALGLFFAGRAADLAGLGRSLSPRHVSARLHEAFDRPGASTPPFGLPFVTFDQPPRR